jgi:putative ABC transport system permease protein
MKKSENNQEEKNMWTEYSIRYIKQNKFSSIFLAAISFLSSALLSLVCGVFYNIWIDRVYRKSLMDENSTGKIEPIVAAYVFILIVICLSLTVMIHNAFEVSMNSRLHQLGILQSAGATPNQIRTFLLQEVLILCIAPIVAGVLSGIGLCYGFMQLIIFVTASVRKYEVTFHYHGVIMAAALVLSLLTVLISAWLPSRRISRLSPLDAIHYGGESPVERMKPYHIFSFLFGIYGELARKSIYSRKRVLKTSTLSLTLSALAFISFLNLEAISGISTQHTYFERYRDKWDIMLTVQNMDKEDTLLRKIRSLNGVESCILYKKTQATTSLPPDMMSEDLLNPDIDILPDKVRADSDGNYFFSTPIYVLDDESYKDYCISNGLPLQGAAAVNIIWDSIHSDRINREYIPILKENTPLKLYLQNDVIPDKGDTPITISAFTASLPEIKEEFIHGSLSLVISQDLYKNLEDGFPYEENFYNIKLASNSYDADIQSDIKSLLPESSSYLLESRLTEEASDTSMRNALKFLMSSFAGLLSCIGIANVFSSTLGQIYQRRKEFARYLSVGLSPKGMRKILAMETLLVGLRPIVFSLIINIPLVAAALNTASIPAKEFIAAAPVIPVLIFTMLILSSVSLAYYLGGTKICNADIADILKDETMI